MSPRLLIVGNDPKYFMSHRIGVARSAREAGYEVHVATPPGPEAAQIAAEGFPHHAVPVRRGTLAPWTELWAVRSLVALYRSLSPDLVHHVTLKPVLYGTLAARLAGVPAVVNAIAGLGYLYGEGGGARQVVLRQAFSSISRAVFRHPRLRFIFQNPEDREVFISTGLARAEHSELIRGSGVDTAVFLPAPEPEGTPVVVLASRLLWDKGVGDFVEAARQLKRTSLDARFALVGEPDPRNPRSVPVAQLEAWRDEGVVEWWGQRSDMPAMFASAHVVTLPSVYREGVPKVLIEAASCGRALVTTDMPGCREIVRHGHNGLLVPPKNPEALADALGRLVAAPALRRAYGEHGRVLVEREFAVEQVIERTLEVYRDVMGAPQFAVA
jgi:glycosyltransferase involved in cell wall biosynthesis